MELTFSDFNFALIGLPPSIAFRFIGQGNSVEVFSLSDFFAVAYMVCEDFTFNHICVALKNIVILGNEILDVQVYAATCVNGVYGNPAAITPPLFINVFTASTNQCVESTISPAVTITAGSLVAVFYNFISGIDTVTCLVAATISNQ